MTTPAPTTPELTALVLNCTLTPSPEATSTQVMADLVLGGLRGHGVTGESVRLVDHDILVVATPTWMGNMSSVAQRVLERLDAELSETDDEGRLETFGKVALAVVVGNEDGAHKITAELFQGLNDVGFTVPANGGVYWNGEAMTTTDFKDLPETPAKVASTIATMTANAAHLAATLRERAYPPAA